MASREQLEFDVVIVGAGPAGLSTAIRLAQCSQDSGASLRICVLEKGPEVGAHILSGAVMDPSALDELLPAWRSQNPPPCTAVTEDKFYWMSKSHAVILPEFAALGNVGNDILSLGLLCRWLAEQAEAMGVEIYAGFAAVECIFNDKGEVGGVITGDMGVNRDGSPGPNFQPGVEIHAKQTVLAEGCRGYLSEPIMQRFNLRQHCQPQTYGLGVKEIWEIEPARHRAGRVEHTVGWPLDRSTYGGSFTYHMGDNKLFMGFVVGLDYHNPSLSPYQAFQQFKGHPRMRALLEGGRRIAYGARALNEGGLQALPKLSFPGGVLVGCGPGMLNVPRIKGIHNAIKSGALAAKAIHDLLVYRPSKTECVALTAAITQSSIGRDLKPARNVRPAFRWGLYAGMMYAAGDQFILRGCAPWTFPLAKGDQFSLRLAKNTRKIDYPPADNVVRFDRLTDLSFSGTNHEENQPCHLIVLDEKVWQTVNLDEYGAPEQYYCPAGVYEVVNTAEGGQRLQINAANCLHCKACDIKDPKQNIRWTPPQGGEGPRYEEM